MSQEKFVRRIQANLDHWLAILHGLEPYHYSKLDPEWSNLLQSIHFGLEFPETRSGAAELWSELLGYVEARSYLAIWEHVTNKIVAILDDLPPAQACKTANTAGFFNRKINKLQTALENHDKAFELAKSAGDPLERGLATLGRANTLEALHRYDEALIQVGEALKILAELDLGRLHYASALNLQGLVHLALGNYKTAEELFQSALEEYQKKNHRRKAVIVLHNLSQAQREGGDPRLAVKTLASGRDLLEPGGLNIESWTNFHLALGTGYFELGEFSLAKKAFLSINQNYLEQNGLTEHLSWTTNNLGNVALKEKDWDLARDYLGYSASLSRQINNEIGLANTLGDLAEALINLGERSTALTHLDEAINLLRSHPDNAWARKRLAAILAQRDAALN